MYWSLSPSASGGRACAPRNVVATETGRSSAEPPRRAQLPRLGLELEAVARLDLDGGDALGDQRIEARQGGGHQLVLGRRPRRLHRGENAAAGARDLLVAGAGQPQLELVRAIAPEHQVRVAVDQARRHPAPAEIDPLGRLQRRHVGPRAHPGDAPLARRDRPVLDDAEPRPRRIERRQPRIGPEPIDLHGWASTASSPSPRFSAGRGSG